MAHEFRAAAAAAAATLLLVASFFSSLSAVQATEPCCGDGYSKFKVNGDNTKANINVNSYNSEYNSNYNINYNIYYGDDITSDSATALVGRKGNGNQTAPEPLALAAAGKKVVRIRTRCEMERVMKVGAGCVDGLVVKAHNQSNGPNVGGPIVIDPVVVKQCCPVLGELKDFDTASDCLCATFKLKALDLKAYVAIGAQLLGSCANTTAQTQAQAKAQAQGQAQLLVPASTTQPPRKFTCSPTP